MLVDVKTLAVTVNVVLAIAVAVSAVVTTVFVIVFDRDSLAKRNAIPKHFQCVPCVRCSSIQSNLFERVRFGCQRGVNLEGCRDGLFRPLCLHFLHMSSCVSSSGGAANTVAGPKPSSIFECAQ